jgi:hypothetical protein
MAIVFSKVEVFHAIVFQPQNISSMPLIRVIQKVNTGMVFVFSKVEVFQLI